jgi:hypothetical protein
MFRETKELPLTDAPRIVGIPGTGIFKELAAAIRRGSLVTEQCFETPFRWHLVDGKHVPYAACAMGAASLGGFTRGMGEHINDNKVLSDIRNCPDCGHTNQDIVPHLNDFHQWTRERIADWLDTF